MAKVALAEGRVVIVNHPNNGRQYIVLNDQSILSVTTGDMMKWGPENGDRRTILNLAEKEFRKNISAIEGSITSQLVNHAKAMGIPVHSREELIQYIKEHNIAGIQQAIEKDGIQMAIAFRHNKK